ncbi:MAG TPA: ABC transporter ATP-binding protein [Myxococcales bacterium]|nr:ABC transporter ATP-binding protein [Myxococcales bacterium]
MQAEVRTEGLSKTFRVGFWGRRVRAISDLSFEVRPGEIFGLLGPNGAGKTTTLKILLGFVKPTSGHAFIAGGRVGTVESRKNLGYLPENPALYEFLRGDEYLIFAGRLSGLGGAEARRRAAALLERVGLAGRADRPIRKFSKGMVQRLALAQALIGNPRIVILDEPMSGLDPIGRKDVRDLILQLRDEGHTVLFSTHILSDVEAICDRVGILVEGRLTDCGHLAELVAPGARAVELVVENAAPELVERLRQDGTRVLQRDRATVFTFPDEGRARAALSAAVSSGATVVSLTPHRRTLEELFVSRARGKAATS